MKFQRLLSTIDKPTNKELYTLQDRKINRTFNLVNLSKRAQTFLKFEIELTEIQKIMTKIKKFTENYDEIRTKKTIET